MVSVFSNCTSPFKICIEDAGGKLQTMQLSVALEPTSAAALLCPLNLGLTKENKSNYNNL